MKKLIRHFKRWNIWRKHNGNGKLHHFLVLIGLIKSPTMGGVWLEEEMAEWIEFCTDVTNFRMTTYGKDPKEYLSEKQKELT